MGIKAINLFVFATLVSVIAASHFKRVTCPNGHITGNEACCVFFDLSEDLQENLFNFSCGEAAHGAIRLTFQDAMGFSESGEFEGNGADGSIVTFSDVELEFAANLGLDTIVDSLLSFVEEYPTVSTGDLVQFAGAVALSNCPGAPQLQFLAGRPVPTIPASDGTFPSPQSATNAIFQRVADVGLTNTDLVHLLAAHSVAHSNFINPTANDLAFDTTPFTFDTQFYLEMLLSGVSCPGHDCGGGEEPSPLPAEGMTRLQSDFSISRDPRTACTWQGLVNEQGSMMSGFKTAMEKVAVIGQDSGELIDCSDAAPGPALPVTKAATFPASTDPDDLQLACASPFPTLSIDPGPATPIPTVPPGVE